MKDLPLNPSNRSNELATNKQNVSWFWMAEMVLIQVFQHNKLIKTPAVWPNTLTEIKIKTKGYYSIWMIL